MLLVPSTTTAQPPFSFTQLFTAGAARAGNLAKPSSEFTPGEPIIHVRFQYEGARAGEELRARWTRVGADGPQTFSESTLVLRKPTDRGQFSFRQEQGAAWAAGNYRVELIARGAVVPYGGDQRWGLGRGGDPADEGWGPGTSVVYTTYPTLHNFVRFGGPHCGVYPGQWDIRVRMYEPPSADDPAAAALSKKGPYTATHREVSDTKLTVTIVAPKPAAPPGARGGAPTGRAGQSAGEWKD